MAIVLSPKGSEPEGSEPEGSEPEGSDPDGNEIDLDAEIDLDEVASPSGVSMIGIEDDEFPTDRPQPRPSIDQIEHAWESPDAWEPQDPISDADVFGDHDDDEFNVIDDQPPTQTVPLANDDQSFFERHHWGRRQRNSIRLLKIASPTLIAVPIIAVILYASGANALFDLLGQSTDPVAAREQSETDQNRDRAAKPAPASPKTQQSAGGGRVAPDATGSPSDDSTSDDSTSDDATGEDSSGEDSTSAMDPVTVVADDDAAAHTNSDQSDDPITPAEADAELVSSDGPSAETPTPDLTTTNRTDVEVMDVDQVIQSIKRTGEAIAEEQSTTAEEPSALTIAMRAKQQWKERHQQPQRQPDAAEQERALLNGATLTFPSEPPSADSVLQTSAQSNIAPEPTAPEPTAPEPTAPEPTQTAETKSKNLAAEAPQTPTIPAPELDTAVLTEACAEAIRAISRWQADDSKDQSARQRMLAQLQAYRSVSRIGSLEFASDSPSVAKLLKTLMESDALQTLEPLCSEWINWGRRQTDGMLLIGRLKTGETESFFELADGSQLRIRSSKEIHVPTESRCVAIGRIISTEDIPLVQLLAGVVVP
ncbi:hypothetical protein [Stieleria magnilauensis]